MAAIESVPLAKNQRRPAGNQLDVEAEARLYRAFRYFWHPVALSREIDAGPKAAVLCGERLVVARLEGEACAFNDLCAHRGTALSLGTIVDDGNRLRCAYHGWQYDKHGLCTLAPQRPDLSQHLRARIKRYDCVERYGMVWVCLEESPRLPVPPFPEYDDQSFARVFFDCEDWACSAPRRTENYCDLAHFAFVHDGYLGDMSHPELPEHEVWREGGAIRMRAEYIEPAGTGRYASIGLFDEVRTLVNWTIDMPLNVRNVARMDNGFTHVLFFHPTPVGPKTTRNFTVALRNYATDDESMQREVVEFNRIIYDQDRPILESQRPEELPVDLSYEMHLKGVDTFHLWYRTFLLELMRELVPAQDGERPRVEDGR